MVKKSLIAAAMVTGMGSQLFGASGQTSVSFNFPDIVILHYVSDVTFSVPASAFGAAAVNEGTGGTLSTFTTPDTLSGDATVGVTISQALNAYKGIINNAWAVRGITASGNIQASITIDTANATNGTSQVTISNGTVSDGTNSGASITFAAPGFSATNAVYGNVLFDIDFSGVTTAGSHTGAQYTVTAAAI